VLEKQRAILPLIRPKTELADLAQIFWQGPKIAAYYGDLLRALLRTAPPVAVQRRAA